MGVVTYIGPESPAQVTVSTGPQVVVAGVNYTFSDPDCSALLAQQPTLWLPGDVHTQTLVPPNYPVILATGSYVGDYDATLTYMKGNIVTGPYLCLQDSTLNQLPANGAPYWKFFGSTSQGPAYSNLGNQGGATAVSMTANKSTWETITLTGDNITTVTPASLATIKFFVIQDANGGHTWTISDGSGNYQLIPISTLANEMSIVTVSSPDGTNLWVE